MTKLKASNIISFFLFLNIVLIGFYLWPRSTESEQNSEFNDKRKESYIFVHENKELTKSYNVVSKSPKNQLSMSEANSKVVTTEQIHSFPENDLLANIDKMSTAAGGGDWETFLEMSELISRDDLNALDLSLIEAIANYAPTYILYDLLNRGANYSFNALLTATRHARIDALEVFVEFGFDLNVRSQQGNSILYYLIDERSDTKVIEFLLNSGLEYNPMINEKNDAFALALSRCGSHNRSELIIQLLHDHYSVRRSDYTEVIKKNVFWTHTCEDIL